MNDSVWGAARTARAIRDGEISVVEAVDGALKRIEECNGDVNAVIEVFDSAREAAAAADGARARGESLGALHGVPVLAKPNVGLAGHPTHDGVAAYLDRIEEETAPGLRNVTDAGAIIVGRTNVPGFSLRWSTDNPRWGRTVNPWDAAVTPGGSSGGSAAAVATGMVGLAFGNDLAGSIRYPAATCGVMGLRPTVGRVPTWHGPASVGMPQTVSQMGVEGPIARTTEDLRLALSVLERFDARDPIALPQRHLGRPLQDRPERVGLVVNPGDGPFARLGAPETSTPVRAVGEMLAAAGYLVEEIEVPLFAEATSNYFELVVTELILGSAVNEMERVGEKATARAIGYWIEAYRDAFGEATLASFSQAWATRLRLRRQMAEFMEQYPILVLPNSGESAFHHGEDGLSLDRTKTLLQNQWPNTAIPLLGLPAIGIGTDRAPGRAPLGVQLVGRSFSEEALFDVADAIEAACGPFDPVTAMKTLDPATAMETLDIGHT